MLTHFEHLRPMERIKWKAKKEALSQIICEAGVFLFSSLWEVWAVPPLGQTPSFALLSQPMAEDINLASSLLALPVPAVRLQTDAFMYYNKQKKEMDAYGQIALFSKFHMSLRKWLFMSSQQRGGKVPLHNTWPEIFPGKLTEEKILREKIWQRKGIYPWVWSH